MAARELTLGPLARAALRLPAGGAKRRKVLVMVAAYADAGERSPSITQLARGTKLSRWVVLNVIDRLQADGLLIVERRHEAKCQPRNVYAIPALEGEAHVCPPERGGTIVGSGPR